MHTSTLSQKYQVVVPSAVRQSMKLKVGQRVYVQVIDENKALITKHPQSHVSALLGLGKHVWDKLGGSEKYIKQERDSWRKK